MPVLTGIDVLGIQRYVFASNRLKDVISASWLVHWATSRDGALAEALLSNSHDRIILASGGNAILTFDDETQAHKFTTRYTRLLYDKAPGLEVVIAHRGYESGALADALKKLQVDLAVAKLNRIPSAPILGISVTASCQVTGLPAVGFDSRERSTPLSRMVLRWRNDEVYNRANKRWQNFLTNGVSGEGYSFPLELDKMGRTYNELSLIGVVHVDGNGVGEKIHGWLSKCIEDNLSDESVREQLNEWSKAIDEIGNSVLHEVVRRTAEAVTRDKNGDPWLTGKVPDLSFELMRSGEKVFLPIRPVLLGGDDLTFLCDGRIALDLAETALVMFERDIPHLGGLSACAGVAIVPVHAPFERAYALAESLCSNAKRRRREEKDTGSWLDWHIGTPRPGETIGELRKRNYSYQDSSTTLELTCRPYRLGTDPEDIESWRWLSATVLGTGHKGFRGGNWILHRNKLKEITAVIREGPDGIRYLRESWTVAGGLEWPPGLDDNNGFFDGIRTPLLDALELLDIYQPLDEGGGND